MELQEERERYRILKNYAHRYAEYRHEKDIEEVIDILNSSDDKDQVISALEEKIKTIHPLDIWYLTNFSVALNGLLSKEKAMPGDNEHDKDATEKPLQCEVCEKRDAPFISVEVSDGETDPQWLAVCGEECLQHVILRWKQIGEIVRPDRVCD